MSIVFINIKNNLVAATLNITAVMSIFYLFFSYLTESKHSNRPQMLVSLELLLNKGIKPFDLLYRQKTSITIW